MDCSNNQFIYFLCQLIPEADGGNGTILKNVYFLDDTDELSSPLFVSKVISLVSLLNTCNFSLLCPNLDHASLVIKAYCTYPKYSASLPLL